MKKLKKILFAAFTVAILSCLLCQPAFAAISESDVQAQVDAVGKEAVSGNVFIWFLCAIGFLKVGQKIDSFLSSLGVNVGHTGGSMLAEATRIIPILYPEVAEQLRLQIETIDALYPDDQLVLGGVHGFVFRNRTGSFMSAHNINRAIERISVTYNMEEMDQAELEDREPDLLPHFSVHNLRHTFCTRLCESTNDVKFIQQVMGHADFSTTMDIYTHITQENMQEKAKNISVNMKLM